MKIINYISYLTLLLAFIIVWVVGFWLIYPYKTIEFYDLPMKVQNKEVVRGEHIVYSASYCKFIDKGATLSRTFVDSIIYTTPELETNIEVGCKNGSVSVYIPKALPTGQYHIKTVFRYQVNPIRTIDVITTTEEFLIVK